MALHDELLAPEVVADPYSYFAELRRDDPVHYNPSWRAWLLTRWEDVTAAFRDARLSADRITPHYVKGERALGEADRLTFELLSRWMVFVDPPAHTRLRGLVTKA